MKTKTEMKKMISMKAMSAMDAVGISGPDGSRLIFMAGLLGVSKPAGQPLP
jgi:hypothetical protein